MVSGLVTWGRSQGVRNNLSASLHSSGVSKAILKELDRSYTSGPFLIPPFHPFKKMKQFTLSLIYLHHVALMLMMTSLLNFSLSNIHPFDDAVQIVNSFSVGCFLAKVDIKHAFRLLPVHPKDWPLLGFQWLGKYFIDTRLPFGSRSSPFIFNLFADALLWILINKFDLSAIIHYLDDFFICGATFEECHAKVKTMLTAFKLIGVPITPEKLESQSRVITFLGIEIDSIHSIIRLPDDKLSELKKLVAM